MPQTNCGKQVRKQLQCRRGLARGCVCTQTAQTLYTLRITAAVSSGKATAGVAFFAANKTILSAPAIDLEGASTALHTVRVSAPQGAMAASVFVGKFDSTGGHIQARTLPAVAQPAAPGFIAQQHVIFAVVRKPAPMLMQAPLPLAAFPCLCRS